MNDAAGWLLFLHQLPPKPDYLRVKVRRRLKGLGRVGQEHGLRASQLHESLEDFQGGRGERVEKGGAAIIAKAAFVEGISDEERHAMVETARDDAADVETTDSPTETMEPGRTWVTRQGVFVDRIGSAWLVRRSIDPRGRFKFVAARGCGPSNEVRFDMVGWNYTRRRRLRSRRWCADSAWTTPRWRRSGRPTSTARTKFARPETAGVSGVLRGIADSTKGDDERLERGFRVSGDLYLFYSSDGGREA
jgi:hypothetical protein